MSILCSLIWFGENISDKVHLFHSRVSYLNMSIEIVFFFLATLLVCVLKDALGINEELSKTDALTGAINRNTFYDLAGI